MTVSLGGRAAEEIVFGAITTGASDDLAGSPTSRADDPRVGDGHVGQRAAALRRGRRRLRPHARAARRRAAAPRRRGDAPRGAADHRAPRTARPARERAAAQRGARARGHRAGSWTASPPLPPLARRGPAGRRRRRGRPTDGSTGHTSGSISSRRCAADPDQRWIRRPPHADGAADDFRALLQPGAIRAVFQPIVRLARPRSTIGYEGLARFPTPPGLVALPPDVTLAAAGRYGLRDDLEVACWAGDRRRRRAARRPAAVGQPLARGARPSRAAGAGRPAAVAARDRAHRAGHGAQQRAAARAAAAVDRPRRAGRRRRRGRRLHLAEYVAEIRPDFLKLSRGMVAGVDRDPSRQAVLRATAAFAREVGARIVAEGVERPEELEALRALEIDYGQGWLFGRPAEAWPEEPAPRPRAPSGAPPAAGSSASSRAPPTPARPPRPSSTTSPAAACCRASTCEDGGRLRCQAVRGFWQVYDGHAADRGHRRARLPHRRAPRSSTTSARRRTTCAAVPGVRAEVVRAAARRRARRRRARRRVADRDRRRDASPRSSAAPRCSARAWRTSAAAAASRPPSSWRASPSACALDDARGHRARDAGRGPRSSPASSPACSRSPTATARLPAPRRGLVRRRLQPARAPRSSRRSPPGSTRARSSYTVGDTAGRGFSGHEVLRGAGVDVADRAAARAPPASGSGCSSSPTAPTTGSTTRGGRAARAARRPGRGGLRMAAPSASCASAPPATR